MSYSTEFLKKRVTILNRTAVDSSTQWGATTTYEEVCDVWASVDWSRGTRALREGALDAYDTVLIRMRWNNIINRESRLRCDGVTYQIQSFHADKQDNTIQLTAQEIIDNQEQEEE